MTVQLCQISLIVQSVIFVHRGREFRCLAPRGHSLTQQRTQNLRIAGIALLGASVLVREILHQRRNALLIITAPVDKAQPHRETTSAQQATSAKLEHRSQSDVKMAHFKTSVAKARVRLVRKDTTVMQPTKLLWMQRYVHLVIIALQALAISVTSLAQNVSTGRILTRKAGLLWSDPLKRSISI